jgi:BirA family biotin operon repressor/biotin-[acetyl-CoA-carboxylase] ligase
MANLYLPCLLHEFACAGDAGIPLSQISSSLKELEVCREWGFDIQCRGDRAYLVFNRDSLIPEWIAMETPAIVWDSLKIYGFLEVGSTNEEALERARHGADSGTLVYAEKQTAGRGRKGRTWISQPGAGLYFSLVVRPNQPRECWPLLTHVTAVALFRAIKDIECATADRQAVSLDLKWPNDILLSGRKCSGILLEACGSKTDLGAAIVGVGVNVRYAAIPPDLQELAICLDEGFGKPVARREVMVGFLGHFQILYQLFESGEHRRIIEKWKNCSSMWNGARILIDDGHRQFGAVTRGITPSGALEVITDEGVEETLFAGDVSVRRAGI